MSSSKRYISSSVTAIWRAKWYQRFSTEEKIITALFGFVIAILKWPAAAQNTFGLNFYLLSSPYVTYWFILQQPTWTFHESIRNSPRLVLFQQHMSSVTFCSDLIECKWAKKEIQTYFRLLVYPSVVKEFSLKRITLISRTSDVICFYCGFDTFTLITFFIDCFITA